MGVELLPVEGFPDVAPGDDLVELLLGCPPTFVPGDVLVVTQKVVSKAEGRLVPLESVQPSPQAAEFARAWDKDPRLTEVVLRESAEVLRMEHGMIISRTRHGLVCANAGVDMSNCDGGATACLLPLDCDASARRLFEGLASRLGFEVPVILSDSFGRPWRMGIVNVAVGVAGMDPFTDYRGGHDPHGLPLKASVMATADALASAAELVMGKVDGVPAAVVRGYAVRPGRGDAAALVRPAEQCLFL